MVWRRPVRLMAVLIAVGIGLGAAGAPTAARAAVGDSVRIEAPRFAAGSTSTVAAVAATTAAGDCRRVRWSLLLRVTGMRLDQVQVRRFEDDGDFPVQTRADGNSLRLTDQQPDPGALCRGRTVTARYRLAFAPDIANGRVTLQVEASDGSQQPVGRAAVTRDVPGSGLAAPAPSVPSATPAATAAATTAPAATASTGSPTPTPSQEYATDLPLDEPEETDETPAAAEVDGGTGAGASTPKAAGFSGVQASFVFGGLLLVLGLGLLLGLRRLISTDRAAAESGLAGAGATGGVPARNRQRRRRSDVW